MHTSKLCANLFIKMGTDITFSQYIYIAQRVALQSAKNLLKPIICKFTRRLAKELVMARRKDACKSNLYPQLEFSATSPQNANCLLKREEIEI